MESLRNNKIYTLSFYIFVFLVLGISHIYLGLKAPLRQYEFIGVIIFDLWLLIISVIDIKTLYIPFWLTAPIILGIFTWRFIDTNYYNEALMGFDLSPALCAGGIAFGFLLSDMITHFGNWFVKYPQSWQGLIPVLMSIPLILITLFIPTYPLWLIPLIICLARYSIYLIYTKNTNFQKIFNSIIIKPWLLYGLLFGLFIFSAIYTLKTAEKMNLIIFILAISFIIEEIILRVFYKIAKIQIEEDNNPSILGGGDSMLAGALGAIWGPIVIANCLEMSFILAFLSIALLKIIKWFQKKLNASNNILEEMAFSPFITISVQIIILLDILRK